MHTAAQLRLFAQDYRDRTTSASQPAAQAMHLAMAAEFERDAEVAAREERREAYRARAEAPLSHDGAFVPGLAA